MTHRLVRDVMTASVVTVSEDTAFKNIAAVMAGHEVNALPVLDAAGRIAGSSPRPTCCARRSTRTTRRRRGRRCSATAGGPGRPA